MIYISLIIGVVVGSATGLCFVWFIKNRKQEDNTNTTKTVETFFEKNERGLKEEMLLNRKEIAESEKRLREELANLFKGFSDSIEKRMSEFSNTQNKNSDNFSLKLSELIDKNENKIEKVKEAVEKKLESLQKDNSDKLEAMRLTVDEKLHSTIEKRFGESFKLVSDRLDLVHKGLGEMQNIAIGVGDLKKVLSNVKTRGTWGEAQLENLIAEILTPEQYGKNVKTKKTGKEVVEFAIKLPGADEEIKNIWLPIDAKFPLEDYQKLIEAQEKGEVEAVQLLNKALEQRIRSEAKDIRDKYINPPYTTDFGILFLPFESLYAEVLRIPGLFELIRHEYKVIVTGPTTIQAILNSLQMGFRTLSIQKRSSEVWSLLSKVRTEFGNFGLLLEKTQKKLQEASSTIESATTKTRNIQGKLNKVQELPVADTNLVSLPAETEEAVTIE